MDGILQFGPLAIATDRALAVIAIWAFLGLGGVIAARTATPAARAAWIATLVGIIAARIGYILENLSAFLVEPWTMLAFWQGGFSIWIGVIAAAGTIWAMLGRHRAAGLLIGALATLSLTHVVAMAALTPDARRLPAGLQLQTTDGRQVNLDSMRGQPFVVNLWATWCPPCRREMPMLIDMAETSSTPILLANQGETSSQVAAFLASNGMADDAVALDPAQAMARAAHAKAFPTTLFIDAGGRLVGVHAGEISRAALSAAIRDLERTNS